MKIGITGNIGSGKTTICRIFETLDIPIYYADDQAKRLMVEDQNVREKIKLLFGLQAYGEDGSLDRKYIGDIVFNNPQMLSRLNFIVHPAVREDSNQWANKNKKAAYTLKEAALLVETEGYKELDKLIVVSAPLELRIQRVMQRDNVNKEAVMARENKQLSEAVKLEKADFIIYNDGVKALVPQVQQIHQAILSLIIQ